MHGARRGFPIFVGLLVLSLLIFFFSQRGWLNGVTGVLQTIILPIQRSSFVLFHRDDKSELAKLKNENRDLRIQLVKVAALEKDNQALRDQFAQTNPPSEILLSAFVVGMPTFLPGASLVDEVIIDRGSDDKVQLGSIVVFKDNLIGKVVKISPRLSVVDLFNHKGITFTAETVKTSALGISQGAGGGKMVLGNVLLSDTLQTGDIVVTKGDVDAGGKGFPPQLVVGKIVSVNKKTSALFQTAEVESLVDVTKLKMVFVMVSY
jgi:rod shape-determining protein MreC